MPGIIASMPNTALPFTLSGVSMRLAGVPISVKSFGSLSATFSGTGSFAAASASSPYLSLCAGRRMDHLSLFGVAGQRIDAPLIRRRRYQHDASDGAGATKRLPQALTDVEPPVTWNPRSGLA